MSKVYLWMTTGVCLSGIVAYNVGNNPAMIEAIFANRGVFWMLIIAQFGAVMFLSFALQRMSALTATLTYLTYAALTGLTFSSIFMVYTNESIAAVFGLSAFSFAGLSSFGFVTKRDLGPVGSFCMMGLFGMVGFSILSIFFPDMLGGVSGQVYSAIGIVVFAGLTAYDTQKIKSMGLRGGSADDEHKGAIFGALTLYLDFINLFISILRLVGNRRD